MGKDSSRKDEYIEIAARLFLEKGYNETSVRDILDAAGDSSPSVLYYYFQSKEDLYRQGMDTKAKKYLQAIDTVINKDQEPMAMMEDFLKVFLTAFVQGGATDISDPESHLFYLHLQEQVTNRYIQVWKKCIADLVPEITGDDQAEALAAFLAGGTGQMIKSFRASGSADVLVFCKQFVDYCGRTLCLDHRRESEFEGLIINIVKSL